MPHVITITGPSRAGKSTVLFHLLKYMNEGFRPNLVTKFTTRRPKSGDHGEVNSVATIPASCDLVYQLYGHRYGLELNVLFKYIASGQSPLVILNDVRAVEDVRNVFGELVRSIFVIRDVTSREYYLDLITSLGELPSGEIEEEARIRLEAGRAMYRTYIENMHLFDHVILNDGTLEDLNLQVGQICKGLEQIPNWPLQRARSLQA